ncbi:protein of unknown function [Micropruina glycogenica]|uniref:Uncharacterized protein n=1 Tax=Micropruina glycogenica TaxID=75385 RepID=A0A2N9JMC9_9ACTN|nr:protein of unknown function [Micropruina glycogenica]
MTRPATSPDQEGAPTAPPDGGGATFTNAFTGRLQRGRRLLAIPVVEPVVARGKAIDGGRSAAQGL